MKLDGIREKVFMDRYSLKDEEGKPTEATPLDMWKRVARGIAEVEKQDVRGEWEKKFVNVMKDFKFVPGGRILSGAGTGYQVTYFNCFVIPSPKDSRGGILDSLKQLVEIQSRSGGVGLNLSSLRPRGARVKKVNGTSSGPVTWAGLFSYATHDVVQQGGTRRGATMLMLWDWHPDVEEFITVKQDLSKINGANLSVCISDSFMEAVKKDADWDLVYPDLSDPNYDDKWDGDINVWKKLGGKVKVHKTIKARYLWDLICDAAWRSAEPGLHFLERSNKRSNTWYFENLLATNPCLPADTWVHTDKGPRLIKDLIGVPFVARVNGSDFSSGVEGFFETGIKEVIRLRTKEGYSLRLTANHKVRKVSRSTRYTKEFEWVEAGELKNGELIVLHDHQMTSQWKGKYKEGDGYLIGSLIGDGTLKSDKAVISVWNPKLKEGPQAVMQHGLQLVNSMHHRSDFSGFMAVKGRSEFRMAVGSVKKLAGELGMYPGNKTITEAMENASSDFYKGLLQGLFDSDGSVQGSQDKGVSVRLSQSSVGLLESVQRMLLRLGIVSTIYKNRRVEGLSMLPDGKGGLKNYNTKSQHELVISGYNLVNFYRIVGFKDTDKALRLENLLLSYKRLLNREDFTVEVESISSEGKESVYDVQIPGINAFDANGLYVHNCGEQPLGAWAVCNLGAMNLAAYVKNEEFDYDSFGKDVHVAMRFLDNVIDQTYYFFPENEQVAKDIRRTGLGIMGIADALIKMKIRYGSDESLPVVKKIFQTLRDSAYDASSDIAKEKGAFPKFETKKYLKGYHIKALPKKLRDKIEKQGIRNAVLLTIAPTGTTSLLAGVSSGIEPVYEFTFIRRDRTGEHEMHHPLFEEWKKENPNGEKPGYYASANDLTPLEHVRVQAVAQDYIDSSISKTVNAPNSHTINDVKTLYMLAYDMGLKGVTYMRDGSRVGVLSRVEEKKVEVPVVATSQMSLTPVKPRPQVVEGVTYFTDSPTGKSYVTVNHNDEKEPFEVFITNGKSGTDVMAMADALGRMISLALRLNSPVPARERMRKIVSELSGIGGARSVGFGENRVRSLPDAIAKVLAKHMEFRVNGQVEDRKPVVPILADLPFDASGNGMGKVAAVTEVKHEEMASMQQLPLEGTGVKASSATNLFDICPDCGSGTLAYEEGCKKCYSCGYSEC